MKRIFIVLTVFTILFTACETDFDVNADWEEITVVYGLLDAGADIQYVKINKAYLGEGDALMMAQYSDSINFKLDDLKIRLHKLYYNDTVQSITMTLAFSSIDTVFQSGDTTFSIDTTFIYKEDGLFAVDNNIIYKAVIPSGFLTDNNRYAITIENKISGNKVSANTEVISNFGFMGFNSNYKFGFYNPSLPDSSKFLSKNIQWEKSKNGEIYQLDLIFHYLENGVLRSLVWSQPLEFFEGGVMQAKFEGVKFFNFLSQNLTPDASIVRQYVNLDLVMTVGTESLNTYIRVNEPITGMAQQRPQFTNINNGIGIFSSRFTHTENGLDLSNDTKNYLKEELDRNFQ